MPRVLRIINRLNLGGPSYNAALLSKYLEPEFETLLVSGMKDETEGSSEFITQSLDLHPVYIADMYRDLHFVRDFKSYIELKKIIVQFKPDIVHTHAAKAGTIGRLVALHCGIPVILHTFHGHVFHSYFGKAKTRLFIEIERYLAKKTTKIIAISEIQKRELSETYKIASAKKIDVIPLGFNLKRFETDQLSKRKSFRLEYNIDDNEIAIGIIGRLVPIKNHRLFLKAIKLVSKRTSQPIRAFIIGDGEDRKKIEGLALSLGIEFNNKVHREKHLITFTSWIKEVDVCIAGMDIIALTSDNEGTPVSLIEAQAGGKAIVSTNVGGIENIVLENETALLSKVNDEKMFAENLLRLVENKTLREQLSTNGRQFVKGKFSYERLCDDMAKLYRSLLQSK
jgi:glycosyltransferase involved in cell wall biosynthesis